MSSKCTQTLRTPHSANILTMLSLFLLLLLGIFPRETLLLMSDITNYFSAFSVSLCLSFSLPCVLFPHLPSLHTLYLYKLTISIFHTSPFLPSSPPNSPIFSQASKIDSLRSKVDLLRLPLTLSCKSISNQKSQLGVVWEKGLGAGGAQKPRPPKAYDMDNESTYSGYSFKSSHSRASRKHR